MTPIKPVSSPHVCRILAAEWVALPTEETYAILAAAPAPVQAEPASPWVAVSERLPDVAQEVIIFSGFEGVCAGVLDSYGEWFAPCSEYKLTRVTHWMPLPAAPEAARAACTRG